MLILVGITSILPMAGVFLARANIQVPAPNLQSLGFLGSILDIIIDVYLTIVSMRLIGLYYLHFKKRFTIVME
jgi:hypothetical protein